MHEREPKYTFISERRATWTSRYRGLIAPRLLGRRVSQIRMLGLPVIKFNPIVKIRIHFFLGGGGIMFEVASFASYKHS